jgi:hypothetical protein
MSTAVVEAPPVIVWLAGRTCFISITTILFAATETAVAIGTEFRLNVKVDEVAALFSTTIFVITAVLPEGVVYSVVPVFVVAAPLKSTFETTGICRCILS